MPEGYPVVLTLDRKRAAMWANAWLLEQLTIRGDRTPGRKGGRGNTAQVTHDLTRYYRLLKLETARLNLPASLARKLYDALSDEWFDERGLKLLPELYLSHEPTDRNGYQWLKEASPVQRLCLADAIERVRSSTYPEPTHTVDQRLRAVGLLKEA